MYYASTNDLSDMLKVSPQRVYALAKQLDINNEETEIKGRNRHYSPSAVKKILAYRGLDFNSKEIIAFCNNKGGTGKTSIAINTAIKLSTLGFKVLLVDADPQSNATSFILDGQNYEDVLFNVVSGSKKMKDCVVKLTENLSIIPSNLQNSRLDMQLSTMHTNQRTYFKNLFEELDYNFIIWDLSPSISTTNFLALLSCTQINIVTTLTDFSVQGVEMTFDVVERAMANFDDFRPKTRALINMFDSRITSSFEHMANIKKIGIDLFKCVIRVDTNVSKSQTVKEPLNSSTNAAKDLAAMIDEIIEMEKIITVQ